MTISNVCTFALIPVPFPHNTTANLQGGDYLAHPREHHHPAWPHTNPRERPMTILIDLIVWYFPQVLSLFRELL